MLSYDKIWSTFLNNYKTEDWDVPQEDSERYKFIGNAVLLYNNKFRTEAVANDELEMVEGLSTQDDLLILAMYVKSTFLENTRIYYERLLQGYDGDVGFKNFTAQLVSIRESVRQNDLLIKEFIFNTRETFL